MGRAAILLSLNEGKVCDAIIRHLEARANSQRTNVCLQDSNKRKGTRVEVTFNVGVSFYALEHTGIEPFPDFIRLNNEAPRLFDPITNALAGKLPPGHVFELQLPAMSLRGRKTKELRLIQDALVRWIIATAPTLDVRSYASYIGDIQPQTPSGVPFSVTLYRFDPLGSGGRFQLKHLITGDIDEARRTRIRLACDKKLPKLAAWKRSEGARTILVLEDNDIQLTNVANVAESFLPIAMARDDRPDETYMVMTCNTTWYAWPILIDGLTYFDLASRYHSIHFEIDPATLTPVTAR